MNPAIHTLDVIKEQVSNVPVIGQTVEIRDCLLHQGRHDRRTGEVMTIGEDSTITVGLPSGETCVAGDWRLYASKSSNWSSVSIPKKRGRKSKLTTEQEPRIKRTYVRRAGSRPTSQSSWQIDVQPNLRLSIRYSAGETSIVATNVSMADLQKLIAMLRTLTEGTNES